MTEGEALYRAILDAPDDDAPRLVWADWLDEHGDPDRAAFVRLQCEWANLDPGDPRQEELWERWGGLLQRHRDRWTADLGPFARNCGFWRGLPDWFDVTTGQLVDQVEAVRRVVPAQCLNLHLDGFKEALRHWPGFETVRCLDVVEGSPDPFYPHSSLRGWVWLLESPRLRSLRALQVDLDVTSAGVLAAMSGVEWPDMRELSVRIQNAEPEKPPAGWRDLAEAPWFSSLKALDLWGCVLGDDELAELINRGKPRALTRLGLGMNHLSAKSIRTIVSSDSLCELRSIELNGNAVGETIGALLRCPRLPNLSGLAASDVTGDGSSGRSLVRGLVESARPGQLRLLELNSNRLDATAVGTLVGSPAASGLEVLSLTGNDLPDAAAFAISASPYLQNLRRLDLAGNRFTDDGLQALAASPHLPALRMLSVRHNQISADALIDFKDSDLACRLWRLETDFSNPPPRKYGYEGLDWTPS